MKKISIKNAIKTVFINKPILIALTTIIVGGIGTGIYFVIHNSTSQPQKVATATVSTDTPTKVTAVNSDTKKKEEVTLQSVSSNQIAVNPLSAIYYAKEKVNIRKTNNTDSEIMKELAYNQTIQVTGQTIDGAWYQVNWEGATGYVKAEYLSKDPLEQTPTEKSNSSNQSNNTNTNSSPQTAQSDTPQPTETAQVQQSYSVGIDWDLTEKIRNIEIYPNRGYKGAKTSDISAICSQVASGELSVDSAISQISSITWQENSSAIGDPNPKDSKFTTYSVVVNRYYIDSSHANDSALKLSYTFTQPIGGFEDAIIYRNSDGSFYVGTVQLEMAWG